MTAFAIVLATGFGLGYVPWIPGTFGAVLGVPLALALARLHVSRQWIVAAVVALIAVPLCGVAEDAFGEKDDGRIVADEFAAFPVAVLGLPVARHPGLLAFAFTTSRILDWTKPPPVALSENVRGGVGIVLDDVLANLYALLVNALAWWVWRRRVFGKPRQV